MFFSDRNAGDSLPQLPCYRGRADGHHYCHSGAANVCLAKAPAPRGHRHVIRRRIQPRAGTARKSGAHAQPRFDSRKRRRLQQAGRHAQRFRTRSQCKLWSGRRMRALRSPMGRLIIGWAGAATARPAVEHSRSLPLAPLFNTFRGTSGGVPARISAFRLRRNSMLSKHSSCSPEDRNT